MKPEPGSTLMGRLGNRIQLSFGSERKQEAVDSFINISPLAANGPRSLDLSILCALMSLEIRLGESTGGHPRVWP